MIVVKAEDREAGRDTHYHRVTPAPASQPRLPRQGGVYECRYSAEKSGVCVVCCGKEGRKCVCQFHAPAVALSAFACTGLRTRG